MTSLKGRPIDFIRSFSVGIASQILWSATNFLTALFLIRYVSVDEFGIYAIAGIVRVLLLTITQSVFVTPITVEAHNAGATNRRLLCDNLILFLLFIVPAFFAIALYAIWSSLLLGISIALFAVSGSLALMTQRCLYIIGRPTIDLLGSSLNFVVTVAGLVLLFRVLEARLPHALMLISLTQICWTAVSVHRFWRIGSSGRRLKALISRIQARSAWGLTFGIQNYLYTYLFIILAAAMLGPAKIAVLEAGRQLMAPVQTLLTGISNTSQPRLATYRNDLQKLQKTATTITANQTAIVIVGVVLIAAFGETLVILIAADKANRYIAGGVGTIIAIWGGIMVAQAVWQHASFALYTSSRFRAIFVFRCIAIIAALSVGYVLLEPVGITAVAWSRLIGELIVAVLYWVHLLRLTQRTP